MENKSVDNGKSPVPLERDKTARDMDLADVLAAIGATWKHVLWSFLVTLAGLAIMVLLWVIFMPWNTVWQHAVRFSFLEQNQKTDQLEYPNGLAFSIADLLSTEVLKKVYERNGLADRKVDFDIFASAVSIAPYALTYQETVTRFRLRLQDNKLTFPERQEIEKEMEETLTRLSQENAIIRLQADKLTELSKMQGLKIVRDIPRVWSRLSIEKRGVLRLPGELEGKYLVNPEDIKSDQYDFPLLLDLLDRSTSLFRTRIEDLEKQPGAQTLVDEKTGLTLAGLKKNIDVLDTYKIGEISALVSQKGVSRNKKTALEYLENRLFRNKLSATNLRRKIANIQNVLDLQGGKYFEQRGRETEGGKAVAGKTADSLTPQIDDGFLARIEQLVRSNLNWPFRKKLFQKKLALQTKLADIETYIEKFEQYKRNLLKNEAVPGDASSMENIKKEFLATVLELNENWKILNRLFKQLSVQKYSHDGQLYVDLGLEENVIHAYPVLADRLVVIAVLLLFLSLLAGVFIGLLKQNRR